MKNFEQYFDGKENKKINENNEVKISPNHLSIVGVEFDEGYGYFLKIEINGNVFYSKLLHESDIYGDNDIDD